MSEHVTEEQLARYRRQRMSAAELLLLDEHLAGCVACRGRVRTGAELGLSFATLTADLGLADSFSGAHLSYEQLADFTDAHLDGASRAAVENHLSLCKTCSEEARSLAAFSDSLGVAEVGNGRPARVRSFRPYERLRNLLAVPRLSAAWGLVAFALLLAAAVATWLGRSQQPASPAAEVARVNPAQSPEQTSRENAGALAGSGSEIRAGAADSNTPGAAGAKPGAAVTPPGGTSGARRVATPEVVTLEDGGRRVTLDSAGELKGLGWLSPSEVEAVRRALSTGRATTPDALNGLNSRSDTLLGDEPRPVAAPFALSSPVGAVVESTRPHFVWQPLAAADRYVVDVYDQSFRKVATSGDLTRPEWTPPDELRRGAIYSWEVTAYTASGALRAPAPPAPEGRFKVLDEARARELMRAERASPRSHLALGVLYARAGLLDEAEREFKLLSNANPRSSAARTLLRDVRERKRHAGR